MSFRRYEIIDYTTEIITKPSPKPFFISPSFFPADDLTVATLDVITSAPFDPFFSDLLQIEESPPFCSYTHKRVVKPARRVSPSEYYLKDISDRVSSLESRFDRLLAVKEKEKLKEADRKYTWTAEIKGGGGRNNNAGGERKYKWTAEIEGDDLKKGKRGERKYQWSTEIKGKDDEQKIYTWKATIGGDKEEEKKEKKNKGKKGEKKAENGACVTRIVEIEDPAVADHRALVLRQAFTKRAAKNKGKKKELSPLDAAALIQMSFRAYLIRRSQALRGIRELAIAKTKLKELRSLFHNFSYRSRVSRDSEERQKFTEKIIVLLITVDSIEGVDIMVRAAKRSMVDELEAMLEVVDPQTTGRSLSMRRRTFDMPSGAMQKEIAEGVAQVVQMLDEENATFEACV